MLLIKISELGSLAAIANDDLLPVVDASDATTKKVTAAQLRDYVMAAMTPSDLVISATTFGQSPDKGSSLRYAREDHTHGTPENPLPAHLAALDPHNMYLRADGTRALTGNLSAGTKRITSLGAPVSANDAANKAYVDSRIQGLDWKESVKGKLSTPPVSPSVGDRYLIEAGATGDWTGQVDAITHWDGSAWVFETPSDGWAVWIEDENYVQVYNGTEWVTFGSGANHSTLINLGADDHVQYLLVDGSRPMTGPLTITDGISSFTLPGSDGTTGQVLTTDGAGTVTWQDSGAGDISGTGVVNQLTYFTGSATIGSATAIAPNALTWDSTNHRLGVRTAAPNEALTVDGAVSLSRGTAPTATSGFGKFYALSADGRPYFLDDVGQAYNLTFDRVTQLTYSGSVVTIDVSPALPLFTTLNVTKDTTFTLVNAGNGRSASVRLVNNTAQPFNLAFPAWRWLGSGTPSFIPTNTIGYITLTAFGPAVTDVLAAFSFVDMPPAIGGTGADDQIAVWTGANSQEGTAALTFNGTRLSVTGGITQSGGALDLSGTAASSIKTTAANLTISTVTSGALSLTAAGNLFLSSGGNQTRWPAVAGGPNTILSNNGLGQLSWVSMPGGIGSITVTAPLEDAGTATNPHIRLIAGNAENDVLAWRAGAWQSTPTATPSLHGATHKMGGSDEIATQFAQPHTIPASLGTGVLDGGWMPAYTGDVSSASGNTVNTINSGVVTNAKLAPMAAGTFKGRNAGTGTGDPQDLNSAQATALLDLVQNNIKGLVPGLPNNAGLYFDGVGGWSSPAGTGGVTVALNVTDVLSITSGELSADEPSQKGDRLVYWSDVDSKLTHLVVKDQLRIGDTVSEPGVVALRHSQVNTSAAGVYGSGTRIPRITVNAFGHVTAVDDVAIEGTGGGGGGLPAAHASTHMHGGDDQIATSAAAANAIPKANALGQLDSSWMPAFSGEVVTTAGATATSISNNAVNNVKLNDMPAKTLKGNDTTIQQDPKDLTVAEVKAMLAYTAGDVTAQPADATLTALAAFNTNGLLTQTAADTFVGRSIAGTDNQISVSNANGVSGNPTLSLASALIIPSTMQVPQNGLRLRDTNNTHNLIVNAGSDLTADRTLTIATGDVNRTLTLTGNASISGTNTGDQSIALSGDVSGSGTASITTTLATVHPAQFSVSNANITVDTKGRVIAASSGSGGGGGSGTVSGTSGQVAFFNGTTSVTSETSAFAWDSTNDALGIGGAPTSPFKLDVQTGDVRIRQIRAGYGPGGIDTTTCFGRGDLAGTSTGANNVAIGYQAADALSGALSFSNTAVGADALGRATEGFRNVAIGDKAAFNVTTGANNIGIGGNALGLSSGTASLTGNGNIAIGNQAADVLSTTSASNTAIGDHALGSASLGTDNVAVGRDALTNLQTGNRNVAVGAGAMGGGGDAFGPGISLTGSESVAVGHRALAAVTTTAAKNVAIGAFAGEFISTGSQNTIIGYYANASATSGALTNSTVIGHEATCSTNNQVSLGNGAVTSFRFGTFNPSAPASSGFGISGIGAKTAVRVSHDAAVANSAYMAFYVNNVLYGSVTQGATAGSLRISSDAIALAGPVTQSGGAFTLTGSAASKLSTSAGALQLQAAASNRVEVNPDAVDSDFRVSGDTVANLLYVDASADLVGVGTDAPNTRLTVNGGISTTPTSVTLSSAAFGLKFVAATNTTYIKVGSTGLAGTSITFTLGNGVAGQMLVLQFVSGGNDVPITLANSGNVRLVAAWTPLRNGTLSLICDGTNWVEVSRSSNITTA